MLATKPWVLSLIFLFSFALSEWHPATLPNEKLTPQTYNEIVDKLNYELWRWELPTDVETVATGDKLSIDRYKNLLQGIERLKGESKEVNEEYESTANVNVILPKSAKIKPGYPVKNQEFHKIRYLLTIANQEKFYEEFVLLELQEAIAGVDPQGHVYDGSNIHWKGGVFIPGRTVSLSPYYIGKYEVTYRLWKRVYDWAVGKGYTFKNSGRKGSHGDSRNTKLDPVMNIAWLDCIVWCNAYTEKEKGIEHCVYRDSNNGTVIKSTNNLNPSQVRYDQSKKGYRLPTEAEWEYVARYQGSDRTNALKHGNTYLTHLDSFSGAKGNYNAYKENDRVAWYRDNSGIKTHPVGQKAPNYAGIYDMSGNVKEMCYDGWNSPPTGTQTDPICATSGSSRVTRGGGCNDFLHGCLVGFRNHWYASDVGYWVSDFGLGRGDDFGFRLAYSQ